MTNLGLVIRSVADELGLSDPRLIAEVVDFRVLNNEANQ